MLAVCCGYALRGKHRARGYTILGVDLMAVVDPLAVGFVWYSPAILSEPATISTMQIIGGTVNFAAAGRGPK